MSVENIWHPVIGYRDYAPTLTSSADWVTLVNNLTDNNVRDFIYLGHGAGACLGDDNPTNILSTGWGVLSSNVQWSLVNTPLDPLTTYSKHPFRFVFFDGCSTAEGEWPGVFAIPKKQGLVHLWDGATTRHILPMEHFKIHLCLRRIPRICKRSGIDAAAHITVVCRTG